MKGSVLCLCLGLGLSSLSSAALGEALGPNPPTFVTHPTLVAGALTAAAGAFVAGSDGAEWALPGGARVVADPGSELKVMGVPQKLALGPRRNTPGYTVMLRSGSVRVSVPPGGRSAVVVGAPRKANVLVVSGSASVAATEERVAVANGDGETSIGVGSDPLRALPVGMVREIDAGAGSVRTLAESPSALEAPPFAFAFGADATLGAFSWPACSGVKGYRVEIRNEKGRLLGSRVTREPKLPSGAFRLSPGKYVARVAGIDPSGLEAARPVERPLRVVAVSVPERGFVDAEGAVHMPAGQSLDLSNVEGAEITYGGGNYFVPAPRTLELVRAEPRLVRFRVPGNGSEAKLWIVPRQITARVEFGPAVPSWPKDALEIRVRVEENGPAPGDPIEVHTRVLLGVDPVEVAFTRDGNTLHGVLPAQPGKGPWVVRVEVADQAGTELGRNFVEVARR